MGYTIILQSIHYRFTDKNLTEKNAFLLNPVYSKILYGMLFSSKLICGGGGGVKRRKV